MWVLNSAALRQASAADSDLAGIERDDRGVPTGRLLRLDGWLRDRLGPCRPVLFRGQLADFAPAGCVPRRDRIHGRDAETGTNPTLMSSAPLAAAGVIPQRLVLMAPPGLREPLGRPGKSGAPQGDPG